MIYLNGAPLNVTIFPDNTSQVWKLDPILLKETNYFHITWEFEHEGEFMRVAQLKQLLEAYGHSHSTLRIKYLPYGRQDKDVGNDATFALHTFAKLLNAVGFYEVIIHDPHSKIALDLIKNSRAVYPTADIMKAMAATNTTIVCYPDKGAVSKYSKEYKEIIGSAFIHGEKVRDQTTGKILSYEVIGNPLYENVLIVDDICDGGATFEILAKKLLEMGAKEVNLFVTHGIFSKGVITLNQAGIKRVFTQDGEAFEDWDYRTGSTITYRRL